MEALIRRMEQDQVRFINFQFTTMEGSIRQLIHPARELERLLEKGVEVILGASRDPRFGPICMFGLGGTFVEALKDVTFRVAPLWEVDAETMIHSIKGYKVLTGLRGMPPSDMEAIKEGIIRLSQLAVDHPEIDELDINPLIVYAKGKGCVASQRF